MEWMKPDTFSIDPWKAPSQPIAPYKPDFADDEELKQAFGIALAKAPDAFKAGMEVFNQELPKALWASLNWVNDPIVIASKDTYLLTLKKLQKPLTKEELLAKLLELADERVVNKEGIEIPLVEAKVRVDALKLYSEISGYSGRVAIDASTNNFNTTNNDNSMKITLVRADNKDAPKVIDNSPNTKSKIQNNELPQIALKLVGGTSR